MDKETKHFHFSEQSSWETIGEGVSRKIIGYDEKLMMVRVKFEKGTSTPVHQHPHSQVSYIISGKFKITMIHEDQILSAGDGFYVPPGIMHAARAIEAGEILDSFSPYRKDILS